MRTSSLILLHSLFLKFEIMRKTKNLQQTLKALLLICMLCFLTATQSHAQKQSTSDRFQAPTTQKVTFDSTPNLSVWNFLQWIGIVTTDVINDTRKTKTAQSAGDSPINAKKHVTRGGNISIATTDMSIRNGGN